MEELTNVTFIGLITLGVVNVVTFFRPDLDSRVKFAISVVVAFGLTFVPADTGSMILEKLKLALEVGFGMSGVYKLASKAGGR